MNSILQRFRALVVGKLMFLRLLSEKKQLIVSQFDATLSPNYPIPADYLLKYRHSELVDQNLNHKDQNPNLRSAS
jgi:hypothetical protein